MTFLCCKSIICYPSFYLKLAVACTTEYMMIYRGQGKRASKGEGKPIADERGHSINCVGNTGTWHSTIGYVRMGGNTMYVSTQQMQAANSGKGASLLSLIQSVLLDPYAIFYLNQNFQKVQKHFIFPRSLWLMCAEEGMMSCESLCRSPYLQRLVLQYMFNNIYKIKVKTCFCPCSTISTKSGTTPFLDARASLARRSLKGRVVAGGWGWTFGGFERFCWEILKKNRCKCVGFYWSRGQVVTLCRCCLYWKQFLALWLRLDDLAVYYLHCEK